MSDGIQAQAIAAALSGKWSEAVLLNKEILCENPKDIDALNRLARSYIELGKKSPAILTIRTILKIDPYNQIAAKLKIRISGMQKGDVVGAAPCHSLSFIEEPGKTVTVALINLASPRAIQSLECAQNLNLDPKRHTVHICDECGQYIGALPDDLGRRLNLLLKNGNRYECFIKSVNGKEVAVFIKETLRCKKYHDIPSFPAKGSSNFLKDKGVDLDKADHTYEEAFEPKQKKATEKVEEEEDDLPVRTPIFDDEEPAEN